MSSFIIGLFTKVIVLFTALPVHEAAHAWASDKLGDPTAKNMGRLTLNPFAHLDLMGSLCILVAGVGWAKPVPINPYRYKNPRVGTALSALAGPASNILLAYIFMIFYKLGAGLFLSYGSSQAVWGIFAILQMVILLNISLAVMNLLPIPPLDGSKILQLVLPQQTYYRIMQYERYIMLAVFFLLFTGILSTPLSFLSRLLYGGLDFLTGYVDILVRLL